MVCKQLLPGQHLVCSRASAAHGSHPPPTSTHLPLSDRSTVALNSTSTSWLPGELPSPARPLLPLPTHASLPHYCSLLPPPPPLHPAWWSPTPVALSSSTRLLATTTTARRCALARSLSGHGQHCVQALRACACRGMLTGWMAAAHPVAPPTLTGVLDALPALQSGCTAYRGCTNPFPTGCYCVNSRGRPTTCSCGTSCNCPGTSQGDGTGWVLLDRAPGVSAVQVKVMGGCGTRWVRQRCRWCQWHGHLG